MGVNLSSQVVSALFPKSVSVYAVMKPPDMERKKFSSVKGKSEIKHSPIAKTAPMLPKSTPISAIQAFTPSPSSRAIAMLCMPNKVKTHQRVSRMAHQVSKTHTRVSLEAAAPQSGKMPSMAYLECSNK